MGTNFYLQSKKPRIVYDSYHIAKTSVGWKPLFQEYCGWYGGELEYHSVKDIKSLYDSGEYSIVDEYDREYTWEQFSDRVLQHDGELSHDNAHTDEDGYQFVSQDFS